MENFAHSRFAKFIIYLIMLSIGLSLVISYSCGGPIDQIFMGWRDSTVCPEPAASCLVGGSMAVTPFSTIFAVVPFLLMIVAINFAFMLIGKARRGQL